MSSINPEALLQQIRNGDVAALSRGITLVESSHGEHRKLALDLVGSVMEAEASSSGSKRIAISGPPGAGKSTLINTLGVQFIELGHKVAVLAVDPSSPLSGGSILGDKTRMDKLAANPSSFVRPSPSGGAGGGVTRSTRESILLCEAAGYDVILVETVGVGQAELAVSAMVDIFVLLTIAGAGDQLQGIKRGILELADIIVITKSDGDNSERVEAARSSLRGIIGLLPERRSRWPRKVLKASAVTGLGVSDLQQTIDELFVLLVESRELDSSRREQQAEWFRDVVQYLVSESIQNRDDFQRLYSDISRGSGNDNPARLATTFVKRLLEGC